MSKIGRKKIATGSVRITMQGNELHYKGSKASGAHLIPDVLKAVVEADGIVLLPAADTRPVLAEVKRLWGLHRALLASAIEGADKPFERGLKIVGLGFKTIVRGSQMEFSLGYSHKVIYDLPAEVSATVDKSGQKIMLTSSNREILGLVASEIRGLRKPEPYKGTGIMYDNEVIRRKAGKTK